MKEKTEDEENHFAAHIPGVLEYHRSMLADGPRNLLLAEAIKRVVTPETTFLDVGAGTGVWAILAAKLGARRVVAIEIEECLIPIIHKHAEENGVADRIEIIHGDCKDVQIEGRFDVIVSEVFAGNAFGAATVEAFIDIRGRFLADGGQLIPEKSAMVASPVRFKPQPMPAGLEISAQFLASLRRNLPTVIRHKDRADLAFLDAPAELVEIDFRSVSNPPSLAKLAATWSLDDVSRANAIAVTNRSQFLDGLELDSLDSQSWSPTLHAFEPFEVKKGTLAISLSMEAESSNWAVSVPSHPEIREQTYGPVFSYTRLKMAQQKTPYKKF